MEMTHPPTLRKPGTGKTFGIVGDIVRIIVTGDETEGKFATFETTVPPHCGPPLHTHSREQESFFVLEGEITFQVGDERFVARAGTFANMPIGSLHCFRNETESPVKMLITVVPAGFEKIFFEAGIQLEEGATTAPAQTPADFGKLMSVAPKFGIEIRVPSH